MQKRTSRSPRAALGVVAVAGIALGVVTGTPAAYAEDEGLAPVELGAYAVELASESTGIPVGELEEQIENGEVMVSPNGQLAFVDPAPELSGSRAPAAPAGGAQIPGSPEGGSRPGAPITIYLDFDGAVIEDTSWNAPSTNPERPTAARYDFAATAAADEAFTREVWERVAEDWAPFAVNVTTVDPGEDALYKTSDSDTTYGSWVVITDTQGMFAPESGGIATYQGAGSKYSAPAFVFTPGVSTAKAVAEATSHEVGHNFGLDHDGQGADEYYSPPEGLWGPIMGAPYESPLTQWSKGGYAGATRHEDDLALITDRAAAATQFTAWQKGDGSYYYGDVCRASGDEAPAPGEVATVPEGDSCPEDAEKLIGGTERVDRADYAADDAGNAPGAAAALDNGSGAFAAAGVIGRTGDTDVFRLATDGGTITAAVGVAATGPNLDAKLTLTNAAGAVIAEDAPETAYADIDTADGLGASVSASGQPAGVYFLTVDGVGQGDPMSTDAVNSDGASAYTDYGSLGNYDLSGSAAPLSTAPIVITSPAEGAEVAGGQAFEVTGTAHPGATVLLRIDGKTAATTEAGPDGSWTARVQAKPEGSTTVVASETVDGVVVEQTASVTVTARAVVPAVEAPVILSPSAGGTTGERPTFSGTGAPGATVEVTVVDADGVKRTARTEVGADGAWSIALQEELADGAARVSATQTLDGRTSAVSAAVAFTVRPAEKPTTGTDPGTGSGKSTETLPRTGGPDAAPFGAAALVLIAAGSLLAGAAVRRRRGRLQH